MPVPSSRIRALNTADARGDGRCVVYRMTAFRRLRSNFALEHAMAEARERRVPLVILEALRVDYPYASDRLHRFVIDGMAEHARALDGTPVRYLPYVEPRPGAGAGLLETVAERACLVVADDSPSLFLPRMIAAAASRLRVRMDAVDSNGLLPMRAADRTFTTAYSFRAYVQRTLRAELPHWPADLRFRDLVSGTAIDPQVFIRWPMASPSMFASPDALIASLPIDHDVPATAIAGGEAAARHALDRFVTEKLARYADDHSHPDAHGTSGLSPYLHFGHLSVHEVFAAVMTHERWTSRKLAAGSRGAREGWWKVGAGAEAFLDQIVTWRELGFNRAATAPATFDRYDALPSWARTTLARHARDPRQWIYSVEALERGETHDEVWNAAAHQLARDGWMHNYLRMLWGKKILEWSPTPEDALDRMTAIMNKLAIDGRDPNSSTGYLWTLGLYDRPWAPERPIFGNVRYMSSDNTRKKLMITRYLATYGESTPDLLG